MIAGHGIRGEELLQVALHLRRLGAGRQVAGLVVVHDRAELAERRTAESRDTEPDDDQDERCDDADPASRGVPHDGSMTFVSRLMNIAISADAPTFSPQVVVSVGEGRWSSGSRAAGVGARGDRTGRRTRRRPAALRRPALRRPRRRGRSRAGGAGQDLRPPAQRLRGRERRGVRAPRHPEHAPGWRPPPHPLAPRRPARVRARASASPTPPPWTPSSTCTTSCASSPRASGPAWCCATTTTSRSTTSPTTLGISAGTVKRYLSDGLAKMAIALADDGTAADRLGTGQRTPTPIAPRRRPSCPPKLTCASSSTTTTARRRATPSTWMPCCAAAARVAARAWRPPRSSSRSPCSASSCRSSISLAAGHDHVVFSASAGRQSLRSRRPARATAGGPKAPGRPLAGGLAGGRSTARAPAEKVNLCTGTLAELAPATNGLVLTVGAGRRRGRRTATSRSTVTLTNTGTAAVTGSASPFPTRDAVPRRGRAVAQQRRRAVARARSSISPRARA